MKIFRLIEVILAATVWQGCHGRSLYSLTHNSASVDADGNCEGIRNAGSLARYSAYANYQNTHKLVIREQRSEGFTLAVPENSRASCEKYKEFVNYPRKEQTNDEEPINYEIYSEMEAERVLKMKQGEKYDEYYDMVQQETCRIVDYMDKCEVNQCKDVCIQDIEENLSLKPGDEKAFSKCADCVEQTCKEDKFDIITKSSNARVILDLDK